MKPPDRHDSISPMTTTTTLATASPVPNRRDDNITSTADRVPLPPSAPTSADAGTGTVSPPAELLLAQYGLGAWANKSGNQEAHDYVNHGQPHEDHSPLNLSHRNPPTVPSPLRLPSPKPDRDAATTSPGHDAIVDEPASPGRRSVQFARADTVLEPPKFPHSRQSSWDEGEPGSRSRSERWMSRLKSTLGTTPSPQPSRGMSELGSSSTSNSPVMTRSQLLPDTLNEEEGSDADADAEESGEEDQQTTQTPKMKKRKRMKRRLRQLDVFTAPNTPLQSQPDDIGSPGRTGRFQTLIRRSTMPEPDTADLRAGLSEGEGRDKLAGKRPGWRRGSSWIGSSWNVAANGDEADSPQPRTPGHRRRISDMFNYGGASDGDTPNPPTRRPFLNPERAATFGAQRWKQVKHTLRMLGKKKTDQFDFYKSAELMAELRAVTPAVVILASMLQRDEHGNKRIPVLLEQLNIRVTDSYAEEKNTGSDRHNMFTIALEYGSGLSRMTWTVTRNLRDIVEMHYKYKLTLKKNRTLQATTGQRGRPKQPAFPRKAFPYLRAYQNRHMSDEDEKTPVSRIDEAAEMTAGEGTAPEATASDAERRPNAGRKKSRINNFLPRRQSSGLGEGREGSMLNPQNAAAAQRRYIDKQRKTLEKYLQEMIHWLMFRPDSNRLCKFLELSALGVRLAAEGNFHGKECYLHIQFSKGIDFSRVLMPSKVVSKHSRKWFLVRQNYIAVVESPATMNIHDVYLVDPRFRIEAKKSKLKKFGRAIQGDAEIAPEGDEEAGGENATEKHHSLKIFTAERKIKLFSRNQTVLRQFEQSVVDMLKQTEWHVPHRFDSFAPVRRNCFAQWLVDGRDYMWNVSRAISMAQDVIYIHDWWLSPELYMRRPACISQKWRLDRLLQRKAREGVKIFVIIYRNVEQAIPIDSEYTKYSLHNLHDNITVLRSPNQLKKNQFFYAHHEKICIVDHDVAFVGGIDLCFGRWDNPQHPLNDDRPTGMEPDDGPPRDAEHCQLFPGKDYSNPRVLDFFRLNMPYEEMYDRARIPRMPWHDIAMQVIGQPARDLTRHFVQRWNYLRRERKPTRPTPFLLPPPDANPVDLAALNLSGTCEVQILRSAGDWSLGLPKDYREHSIQTAYIKLIEESEHFVYMENQFFITSTETLGTKVENRIGDALVARIVRAHENNEDWRCCILIPLMPGFQNTVDQAEGSSVRLIMQFQYRSICRGPHSIFGRLEALGISPEDYISFFSLRNWGRLGKSKALVTEQLYIHAKTIIVDDRVVLIGSANINERSMLGNRDSETAAIVRDTEMMWSTMAGEPYQVGRFAHTLRMRLMREHLGLDVDQITEEERIADQRTDDADYEAEMARIYGEEDGNEAAVAESSAQASARAHLQRPHVQGGRSFNHDAADQDGAHGSSSSSSSSSSASNSSRNPSPGRDDRVDGNATHDADVAGYGADHWKEAEARGADLGSDSMVINGHEVLIHRPGRLGKVEEDTSSSNKEKSGNLGDTLSSNHGKENQLPPTAPTNPGQLPTGSQFTALPVIDDSDIGGPSVVLDESGRPNYEPLNPLLLDIEPARIDKDCMRDPVCPEFWDDVWSRVARNNTMLYRRVFRCMPDSEVSTWKEYHEFDQYARKFSAAMFGSPSDDEDEKHTANADGAAGGAAAGVAVPAATPLGPNLSEKLAEKLTEKTHSNSGHAEHEASPEAPTTNGESEIINEKLPVSDCSDHAQVNINVDKSAARDSHETASHSQSGGEVPFPPFEGQLNVTHLEPHHDKRGDRRTTFSASERSAPDSTIYTYNSTRRRRRATTRGSRRGPIFPYDVLGREDAEELCGMIQGHLVQFAYDWLESEEKDNHWLYQADLLAPKEIYD